MSETQTLTLTGFLLARIAQDEADAWAASGLRAEAFVDTKAWRECEAKRRIVGGFLGSTYVAANGATLRALAAIYADHPDYREEWRP